MKKIIIALVLAASAATLSGCMSYGDTGMGGPGPYAAADGGIVVVQHQNGGSHMGWSRGNHVRHSGMHSRGMHHGHRGHRLQP